MDFAQRIARTAAEAAEIRKKSLRECNSKKAKAVQTEQTEKWQDLEKDPKWDVISSLFINWIQQLILSLLHLILWDNQLHHLYHQE